MIDIKRDILIEINWIQKIDVIMTREKIKFNVLKSKILKWLKNLKKVFETIFEEELPSSRDKVDHEIILKIKEIKPSLLISTKSKEQEIIKEYLDEILRKE